MAVVQKSALVRHSVSAMFQLINDVAAYPEFLPWCASARVISESESEQCAEIEVAKSGVRQSFTTCNKLTPSKMIEIHLKDGPFKRLDGGWVLTPLGDNACKVELQLEFEFSSRIMDLAFGSVFRKIADTLVDSFCKRADEVLQND